LGPDCWILWDFCLWLVAEDVAAEYSEGVGELAVECCQRRSGPERQFEIGCAVSGQLVRMVRTSEIDCAPLHGNEVDGFELDIERGQIDEEFCAVG